MPYHSGRQTFFLPTEGNEPEVIGADLEMSGGGNAQVRADRDRGGYTIRARNMLTTDMIANMRADSREWQTEQARHCGYARYSGSATHQECAAYGPTPHGSDQRAPLRQASFGSAQSQPAQGSMSSRAISGVTPGDYPLSQQCTRSDTSARCGRPGTDFAPFSEDFSQVNNYTNTGQTTTQPMAISSRLARKDSNDSMFGFSKSPMADELRCPPSVPRRDHQMPPYEYDHRYGE